MDVFIYRVGVMDINMKVMRRDTESDTNGAFRLREGLKGEELVEFKYR